MWVTEKAVEHWRKMMGYRHSYPSKSRVIYEIRCIKQLCKPKLDKKTRIVNYKAPDPCGATFHVINNNLIGISPRGRVIARGGVYTLEEQDEIQKQIA